MLQYLEERATPEHAGAEGDEPKLHRHRRDTARDTLNGRPREPSAVCRACSHGRNFLHLFGKFCRIALRAAPSKTRRVESSPCLDTGQPEVADVAMKLYREVKEAKITTWAAVK